VLGSAEQGQFALLSGKADAHIVAGPWQSSMTESF
jgi:hypothetical protein